MKIVLKTKKMEINLNTMFKNLIKLAIFTTSMILILSDIYKLVLEPYFTGYLTTYTLSGLVTLIVAMLGIMCTYNDLKEYIGG